MFQFFKKQKEKEELAIADRKKRINKSKEIAIENLDSAIAEMFKKPCPINNNDRCFAECIHFKRWSVFYMPPLPGCDDDGHWETHWPRCKLWGEN